MSCCIALTLPRHVVLVSDSMRRVFGRHGDAPFTEPIRVEDARKLHRVSDFLWATGIGLAGFHQAAAHSLRDTIRMNTRTGKISIGDLGKMLALHPVIHEAYASRLEEFLVLAQKLGGSLFDPRLILTDFLLGAMTTEDVPVLLRYTPCEDCAPESLTGPGRRLMSPGPGEFARDAHTEIQGALESITECLMGCEANRVEQRAWELLPAVMAMAARARPGQVSASGDFVVIGTERVSLHLF